MSLFRHRAPVIDLYPQPQAEEMQLEHAARAPRVPTSVLIAGGAVIAGSALALLLPQWQEKANGNFKQPTPVECDFSDDNIMVELPTGHGKDHLALQVDGVERITSSQDCMDEAKDEINKRNENILLQAGESYTVPASVEVITKE